MSELKLINLKDVEPEKVEWLWYPYIPRGKITLIRGDPGEGKTMFVLDLISSASRGALKELEGNDLIENDSYLGIINSIYQTAEDGLADTVKPRLLAADADCEHVMNIDESIDLLNFKDERIEMAILETEAKILVLDPLQAYIGEDVDMNRANEVRPAFRALADVAARTKCAIVIVEHMNKMSDKKSLMRGLGSIDITGAARSILLICRPDEKNPNDVYMAHVKSNLAEKGPTLRFTSENGRLVYRGKETMTANELLGDGSSVENTPTKKQQAMEYLQQVLSNGDEIPAQEIIKDLVALGIGQRTTEIVKKEMNIKSVKHGECWYWIMKMKEVRNT